MCNILVIDDETAVSGVIQRALSKFGFKVETAQNGHEGIAKFDEGRFGLVITDICMPEIDGKGVVSYIRNSEGRLTPVIGISGTPWLFEDGGFDAVLAKPFSIQALMDAVNTLTGEQPAGLRN